MLSSPETAAAEAVEGEVRRGLAGASAAVSSPRSLRNLMLGQVARRRGEG